MRARSSSSGGNTTIGNVRTRRWAIEPRRSLPQKRRASTEMVWGQGPQTPAPCPTPPSRYAVSAGRTKRGESLIIGGLKMGGRSGLVTYRATVQLLGVTLRSERISLDSGIVLRRTTKEDLEKVYRPMLVGALTPSFQHPLAILEIELQLQRGQQMRLQERVEQCIALLRLFVAGSIKWISYSIESGLRLRIRSIFQRRMGSASASSRYRRMCRRTSVKAGQPRQLKNFSTSCRA